MAEEVVLRGVLELKENISAAVAKAKSATEAFTKTTQSLRRELDAMERKKLKLIDAGASAKEMERVNQSIDTLKKQLRNPTQMKVKADVSPAKSEIDKLKGAVATAIGGLAIGATVASAFKTGIDYNASMEQSAISWETILGNQKEAAATMERLVNMAAKTPFEFPELDKTAKKLRLAGFQGDEMFKVLTNIGDAVSAIGGDSETLNGISTALYQIYTKGKLSAEEMLQLGERGIPAWEILADKMGEPFSKKWTRESSKKRKNTANN